MDNFHNDIAERLQRYSEKLLEYNEALSALIDDLQKELSDNKLNNYGNDHRTSNSISGVRRSDNNGHITPQYTGEQSPVHRGRIRSDAPKLAEKEGA